MAKSYRLPEIARERGIAVDQLVPTLLAEHGTPFKAAMAIGVYPNSIFNWLKRNGWRSIDGTWVRPKASMS